MKKFITEIEPIGIQPVDIKKKDDIKKYVKLPLIASCEILWEKNIQTYSSSANRKNIGNYVHINLNWNTLSPQNKKIGRKIGKIGNDHEEKVVSLKIPISSPNEKIENISNSMICLVSQFKKQKLTWGFYAIEEYLQAAHISEKELDAYTRRQNHICDRKKGIIWISEEDYEKASKQLNQGTEEVKGVIGVIGLLE